MKFASHSPYCSVDTEIIILALPAPIYEEIYIKQNWVQIIGGALVLVSHAASGKINCPTLI